MSAFSTFRDSIISRFHSFVMYRFICYFIHFSGTSLFANSFTCQGQVYVPFHSLVRDWFIPQLHSHFSRTSCIAWESMNPVSFERQMQYNDRIIIFRNSCNLMIWFYFQALSSLFAWWQCLYMSKHNYIIQIMFGTSSFVLFNSSSTPPTTIPLPFGYLVLHDFIIFVMDGFIFIIPLVVRGHEWIYLQNSIRHINNISSSILNCMISF